MNTLARALFLSIVTLTLCEVVMLGQAPTSTSSDQEKCGSIKATPFSRTDAPVIFGEPYIVPAIELRVVDESTGKPQAGKQVDCTPKMRQPVTVIPGECFAARTRPAADSRGQSAAASDYRPLRENG